ncbi:response regulator transcription factor [Nonomuraea sp. NBC_00507]|uniref:response regulator transcription factor n=1 Tax=Nonomuraea sp. NBC_00507 TaxID=2976002 RepID=UPI002E18A067
MRVLIADDEVLLREGLDRLLTETGVEVAATVGDAPALLRRVEELRPDIAIVDIRMPPTHTDEGLVAALKIREEFPGTGVLVLSHYLDSRYAMQLLDRYPEKVGYLLKERVSDLSVLLDALRRIAEGECVVDPTIVTRLMSRRRRGDPLDLLSKREREVLSLMAEGHSNQGICDLLHLSLRTVEAHVGNIFAKLRIPESTDRHRRVLAVLTLLRST